MEKKVIRTQIEDEREEKGVSILTDFFTLQIRCKLARGAASLYTLKKEKSKLEIEIEIEVGNTIFKLSFKIFTNLG